MNDDVKHAIPFDGNAGDVAHIRDLEESSQRTYEGIIVGVALGALVMFLVVAAWWAL